MEPFPTIKPLTADPPRQQVRIYVHAQNVYDNAIKFHNVKWVDYASLFQTMLECHLAAKVAVEQITLYTSMNPNRRQKERQEHYHRALTDHNPNLTILTGFKDNDEIIYELACAALGDMCGEHQHWGCIVADDSQLRNVFMKTRARSARLLWASPHGIETFPLVYRPELNHELQSAVAPEDRVANGISRKLLLSNLLPVTQHTPPAHPGWRFLRANIKSPPV